MITKIQNHFNQLIKRRTQLKKQIWANFKSSKFENNFRIRKYLKRNSSNKF